MALTQAPTEICASAPTAPRSAASRSTSVRSAPPHIDPKKTKRQRGEEASMASKRQLIYVQLPQRLMASAAFSALASVGLGIYGMECDSGLAMLVSGAAMVLGAALMTAALVRYRAKQRQHQP